MIALGYQVCIDFFSFLLTFSPFPLFPLSGFAIRGRFRTEGRRKADQVDGDVIDDYAGGALMMWCRRSGIPTIP